MPKFTRSKFKLWVYLTLVLSKYLCRPVYIAPFLILTLKSFAAGLQVRAGIVQPYGYIVLTQTLPSRFNGLAARPSALSFCSNQPESQSPIQFRLPYQPRLTESVLCLAYGAHTSLCSEKNEAEKTIPLIKYNTFFFIFVFVPFWYCIYACVCLQCINSFYYCCFTSSPIPLLGLWLKILIPVEIPAYTLCAASHCYL